MPPIRNSSNGVKKVYYNEERSPGKGTLTSNEFLNSIEKKREAQVFAASNTIRRFSGPQ